MFPEREFFQFDDASYQLFSITSGIHLTRFTLATLLLTTLRKKVLMAPKHFQKLFSLTTPVLRRFGKSLLSLQKKGASIFHICNLGNNTTEQPLVLNVSDAPQSLFSWIVVWYIYTHTYIHCTRQVRGLCERGLSEYSAHAFNESEIHI